MTEAPAPAPAPETDVAKTTDPKLKQFVEMYKKDRAGKTRRDKIHPDVKAKAKELHDSGISWTDLGEAAGVSAQAVMNWFVASKTSKKSKAKTASKSTKTQPTGKPNAVEHTITVDGREYRGSVEALRAVLGIG